eukprot:TRINITY_DN1496_c0_g1_i1.p1 TRINITY_DN1496_c0_g1~~TRINITY_DN1496_c0_g1_i1.p1  ORF type:complete len:422 (+),score=152.77 TRINITY_DN1496_c0_g1_i1:35-1300(+)
MEAKANRRLGNIINQLQKSEDVAFQTTAAQPKNANDVVIVCAIRTPIGKAKRGNLKDTHWTDLLATVLKGVVDKTKINPKDIEDVQVGTVLAAGGGAVEARMAMFAAGYPEDACLATTNRQCSSGLQAFANIAGAIRTGTIKVGVAAGVESMSQHNFANGVGQLNDKLMSNQEAADCLLPMGITSENVAAKYGLSRKEQDEFAAYSQQKAAKAQKQGLFKEEIIPVHTSVIGEDGNAKEVVVSEDEGIRETTAEALNKLKPAFKKDGTTTAGNSSQVSDGAAAVLVMTRAEAERRNLPIIGRFLSFAVAGVPPNIMGVGPAYAIPPAVSKAGLNLNDINIFEINEAFASQAKFTINHLGIPIEKVNPLGGAIALGHPLGCTGARMIATLIHNLRRTKQKYGVVSMCIGTGMGAAGVFEAEF